MIYHLTVLVFSCSDNTNRPAAIASKGKHLCDKNPELSFERNVLYLIDVRLVLIYVQYLFNIIYSFQHTIHSRGFRISKMHHNYLTIAFTVHTGDCCVVKLF